MKQSETKNKSLEPNNSSPRESNERQRKPKLKPLDKQKYKPKQVYRFQTDDEDEELDLFGYLEEEE